MKSIIYFRADGNANMGLGHVVRSLALAEMLQSNFECHFLIRNPLPTLRQQILEVCKTITELPDTENHDEEAVQITVKYLTGNEIVVLDGYHFKTKYQRIIKNTGCKLVCIDDIHAYHFVADVIINHAGGISISDYSKETYTRVYLGLQYALLRKPFRDAAKNRRIRANESHNILICFGGADPANETLKALQKCELAKVSFHCFVVIGAAYKHTKELNNFIRNSFLSIEILANLDAIELVNYMKKCSVAITAPSSIALEYLCTSGTLYLKMIANNQLDIYHYFLRNKIAFSLDDFPLTDNNIIEKYLQNQQILLDGKSGDRIMSIFKSIAT